MCKLQLYIKSAVREVSESLQYTEIGIQACKIRMHANSPISMHSMRFQSGVSESSWKTHEI